MDTGPYYAPQSVAPILERGAAQQVPLVSQPTGVSGALPAIGNLAQAGLDVASQQQKKKSVMDAQQAYSHYLAKVDAGTATPQDHQTGYMAALSLGIAPKSFNNTNADPSIVAALQEKAGVSGPLRGSKENVAGLEKLAGLNKKPSGSDQNLTPQEMNALRLAAVRKNNPLPVSLISFRGPRAKIIAQSLMNDPNWSPTTGEQSLVSARATGREQGGKGFEIASNVGSLDDTLRQMEPLIKQLSPTSLQILNNAWQKGLAQTNDAQANQVLALANSARGLYSQVIAGGAGTVESDKKANETIARGLNAQGFQGMKAAVMAEGYSRASRMTGATPNTLEKPVGYIDQGSKVAAPGYKIGQVVKGTDGNYSYSGGDPKDKNNWQKVQ